MDTLPVAICLCIGDSPCFLYHAALEQTEALTPSWKRDIGQCSKSHGYIGALTGTQPDISEAVLQVTECEHGDMLIVMSDGFSDNISCCCTYPEASVLDNVLSSRLKNTPDLNSFTDDLSNCIIEQTSALRDFYSHNRTCWLAPTISKLDHCSLCIAQVDEYYCDIGLINVFESTTMKELYPERRPHSARTAAAGDLLPSRDTVRTPSLFKPSEGKASGGRPRALSNQAAPVSSRQASPFKPLRLDVC